MKESEILIVHLPFFSIYIYVREEIYFSNVKIKDISLINTLALFKYMF